MRLCHDLCRHGQLSAANFPLFPLKQMRKPYASSGSICAPVGFHDTFYDADSSRAFIHPPLFGAYEQHMLSSHFRVYDTVDFPSFDFRRTAHLCYVVCIRSYATACGLFSHIRGLTMDAGCLFYSDGAVSSHLSATWITLLCPRSTHVQLTSPHLMRQGGNRPS